MNENTKKTSWSELLKHPTVNLIIGFILTGVMGAGITNYYTMKRQKEAKYQEMVDTNKAMVSALASLNAELRARAEMFLLTIEDGDTDSIKEMKKMFIEASLRWKTESIPVLMAARGVLPKEKYYLFRNFLENEFNIRFLEPMSHCLDRACAANEAGNSVDEVLTSCQARDYLAQAGKCNNALLDILYEVTTATVEDYSKEELNEQKQAHEKLIATACAAP